MLRSIKHFSLHRINATELRVVSDVAEGVLPVIEAEESVVQKYSLLESWPHRWVTLFVLEDLQPLLRQLRQRAQPANLVLARQNLSAEDVRAFGERPVVNVYDLADLSTCNIFVNRQEMMTQHYWNDPQAMRGLMAHEHAHPLAENEITQASRQISVQVSGGRLTTQDSGDRLAKITPVLGALAEKLSVLAPRELLTNELTIRSSFSEDLLHLNMLNVGNAGASITGRQGLAQHLQEQVLQGELTEKENELLLLVGDLNGFLPLALEIAPFYRAGRPDSAGRLERVLDTSVFPYLDSLAVNCFKELLHHFITLPADNLSSVEMAAWSDEVLQILCNTLQAKDFTLQYQMGLLEG